MTISFVTPNFFFLNTTILKVLSSPSWNRLETEAFIFLWKVAIHHFHFFLFFPRMRSNSFKSRIYIKWFKPSNRLQISPHWSCTTNELVSSVINGLEVFVFMLCCLSQTVLVRENSLYRKSLRQNPRKMI